MKEAPPTRSQFRRLHRRFMITLTSKNKLAKATACLILAILSYALGYLHAQSSSKPQPAILADDTLTTAAGTVEQRVIAAGSESDHNQLTTAAGTVEQRVIAGTVEQRVIAAGSESDHNQLTTAAGTVEQRVIAAGRETDHNLFGTKCADPIPPELVLPTILDRVFNGTSPWENFPPEQIRAFLKPKWIKGWGSRGAVFENLIRKVQPKTIIEIGTFLGASALHMAKLTREMGLKSQIVCIDDFRGWPGFREAFKDIKMVNGEVMLMYQFMQNVVHANATDSVMFMPFSSGSALEKLCEWGVSGDLIEVDAGHDFHSAWTDINRAHKILRGGGVMFGHDYFTSADNRGVRRAVNLFARINNLRIQVDGQHWVLGKPPA